MTQAVATSNHACFVARLGLDLAEDGFECVWRAAPYGSAVGYRLIAWCPVCAGHLYIADRSFRGIRECA